MKSSSEIKPSKPNITLNEEVSRLCTAALLIERMVNQNTNVDIIEGSFFLPRLSLILRKLFSFLEKI
jgi:hypothetical protein